MPLRGVAGAKFLWNLQWWAYWTCSWAYLLKIMPFKGIWNFSHWLIMGRSWNWPDLRSQISKIPNIHFVGGVTLTNFWEFHINHFIVVALAWVQTFPEVGLFDLTLDDLGLIFAHNVRNRCQIRCAKFGGAARRRFSLTRKKLKGGVQTPPPQQGEG